MHYYNCPACKKDFSSPWKRRVFCSLECSFANRRFKDSIENGWQRGKCKDCQIEISKNESRCDSCSLEFKKTKKFTSNEKCTKCGVQKDTNNTYRNSSGKWATVCRSCKAISNRLISKKLKQECVDYKGGKCQNCGYCKSISALDFHHLDPRQKDFTIGDRKSRVNSDVTKKELDKCVLLCSNCHREEHSRLASGEPSLLAHASEELDWLGINSV